MAKGIDCATPLTTERAKTIAAAGYQFVCRYLVPEQYAWKRLTKSEAEAISQTGMNIISVWETTADRAAGGASAGKPDGVAALKEAQSIGQPLGSAIYFAVDFDAQPKHYDAIERYLRAAGEAIPGYEVGVYGSCAVVEEMIRRSAARHAWQTYAWSHGQKSQHANIYQYKNGQQMAGITVDLNESYGGEGWWNTMTNTKTEIDKDAAQKVINILGSVWQLSADKAVQDAAHYAADALRDAAGLPKEQ
jgi:hypothetical protein